MTHVNEQLDGLSQSQSALFKAKWPKSLVELSDVISACLEKEKVTDAKLTEKIISAIAFYFGGRGVYLPNGRALEHFLRNQRIYQEFDGKNGLDLAKKYDMSERRIHQIRAEFRELYRSLRDNTAMTKMSG